MSYKKIFIFIVLAVIIFFSALYADNNDYRNGYIRDSEYLRVYYKTRDNLQQIIESGLIIDRIVPDKGYFSCYACPEHISLFEQLGLEYRNIPTTAQLFLDPEYRKEREAYRTFAQVETELQDIASTYPALTQLITVGTSVQGRGLYFLRITSDIQTDPIKPEFHYISTMHGNEPVGTELCMEFINYLVQNYGTDAYVTDLLDEIDIYVMPVMNPDGNVANTRYNANGYDLNRNFPDFINNPEDTTAGKQAETAALMQFYAQRRGVLSANFHTGALVVNYPWDTTYNDHPETPMAIELSLLYSSNNLPMYNSSTFDDGITNGADWYVIDGGMQDYSCYYHSNFQVTVECSDAFAPPASNLPQLWQDNKNSMLYYAGATRRGIQGYILDGTTHEPVPAEITVNGIDWVFENDVTSGFFHKMLLPGTYTVTVSADGYLEEIISSIVIDSDWNTTTFLGDIYMQEDTSSYISCNSNAIDDYYGNGNGILNPGETAGLTVNINNNTAGTVTGLTAVISCENPYVTISQDSSAYPDMAPGGNGDNTSPYTLSVSGSCPHDEVLSIRFDWSYARMSGAFYIDIQVKSMEFVEIGSGTVEITNAPLYTYYEDNRTQVIYTAEDMGNTPMEINSLSIFISSLPSMALTDWTIRLKHTAKADYESSAVFEATGWTVVYQNTATISETGWNEFLFPEPFSYDGSQNLMIDFSFNNSSWASPGGKVYWTGTPNKRAIYGYTDSGYGDPLNWTTGNTPTVYTTNNYINLKLGLVPENLPMNLDKAVISLNPDFRFIYEWEYSDAKPVAFEEKGSTWLLVMNGNYAQKIVSGDITGDGKAELIAYFEGSGLYYYDFIEFIPITSGAVNDFALADIEGTGKKTLIASLDGYGLYKWVYTENRADWLFSGTRSGSWIRISTQCADIIQSADIYKNGIDELFLAFSGINGGYIYSFSEDTFFLAVSVSPSKLGRADIDGDGYDELICAFDQIGIYILNYSQLKAPSHVKETVPCFDPSEDIQSSFSWVSKEENRAFQWMRILIVSPDAEAGLYSGNITSDSIDEIFTVIAGRTYYYQPSGHTWSMLVPASFDTMTFGRFTQEDIDDILLSSRAGNFIYLYKAAEASFERILGGVYASSMDVLPFDQQR